MSNQQTLESTRRPNQDVASEAILELARADRNVLVVTSDSRGSGKLVPFAQELPKQLVEVGIAEQNLVGVAAGLASTGKTVCSRAIDSGTNSSSESILRSRSLLCWGSSYWLSNRRLANIPEPRNIPVRMAHPLCWWQEKIDHVGRDLYSRGFVGHEPMIGV